MCIGLPMQVLSLEPGHALCRGRGGTRRVRTALVGEPAVGDWLLVFLDSARGRLAPQRAHEIAATLDLLDAALAGAGGAPEAAFVLPSQTSLDTLRAVTGGAPLPRNPS